MLKKARQSILKIILGLSSGGKSHRGKDNMVSLKKVIMLYGSFLSFFFDIFDDLKVVQFGDKSLHHLEFKVIDPLLCPLRVKV